MGRMYVATKDIHCWKKIKDSTGKQYVAEMIVPQGTKYFAQNKLRDGKCRAEKVFVVALYEHANAAMENKKAIKEGFDKAWGIIKDTCDKYNGNKYPSYVKSDMDSFINNLQSNTKTINSTSEMTFSKTKKVVHYSTYTPCGTKHAVYEVGKMTYPHEFSPAKSQCAGGIHFFGTPEQSFNWN